METKHTPGPWVADDNEGFSLWSIWSRMAPSGHGTPGRNVAVVHDCSVHSDADAQLIAAAPELLEACLKLVEWDDREKDHAISFMARIDLCEEAFTAMRAAIAKATQ